MCAHRETCVWSMCRGRRTRIQLHLHIQSDGTALRGSRAGRRFVCFTCGFIYNNIKTNYTKKAETPANNILYNVLNQNFPAMVEYYLYYFGIIVFFGIIIGMLNINNTPERSLIFKEQTMYQSSSLDKVNQLPVDSKRDCVVPDSYFKNEFMNKEMCKKNDGIEKGGKYNPVGMKVFSWMRFLVLQDVLPSGKLNGIACKDSCPPASLLFCTNGFEQKWGQCKYGVNGVLPSPFTWNGLKKTTTWKDTICFLTTASWKIIERTIFIYIFDV